MRIYKNTHAQTRTVSLNSYLVAHYSRLTRSARARTSVCKRTYCAHMYTHILRPQLKRRAARALRSISRAAAVAASMPKRSHLLVWRRLRCGRAKSLDLIYIISIKRIFAFRCVRACCVWSIFIGACFSGVCKERAQFLSILCCVHLLHFYTVVVFTVSDNSATKNHAKIMHSVNYAHTL